MNIFICLTLRLFFPKLRNFPANRVSIHIYLAALLYLTEYGLVEFGTYKSLIFFTSGVYPLIVEHSVVNLRVLPLSLLIISVVISASPYISKYFMLSLPQISFKMFETSMLIVSSSTFAAYLCERKRYGIYITGDSRGILPKKNAGMSDSVKNEDTRFLRTKPVYSGASWKQNDDMQRYKIVRNWNTSEYDVNEYNLWLWNPETIWKYCFLIFSPMYISMHILLRYYRSLPISLGVSLTTVYLLMRTYNGYVKGINILHSACNDEERNINNWKQKAQGYGTAYQNFHY